MTFRLVILTLLLMLSTMAFAGSLESFLDEVDLRARADLGAFRSDLSVTFGVSDRKLDALFEVVHRPSDVYMCLRLGEVAHRPVDHVVESYRQHRGQGWGVIAKNLGIKPGSSEFHALKSGRLPGHSGKGSAKSKGKPGKGRK